MLELFLSLLLGKEKSEKLSPLLTLLKDNNYNLKDVMSNLDLTALMPLVTSFTEGFSTANDNAKEQTIIADDFNELTSIAGEEITDLLNAYLQD